MKLTKEAVNLIGKVIGAKLNDLSRLDEALTAQNKQQEFKEVADFLLETGTQIGKLLHKWKNISKQRCLKFPDYKDVDLNALKMEKNRLVSQCEGKFKKVTSFANEANSGKTFVQVDMQSANYTAFKQITGVTTEWNEFFKTIIPNVKTADRKYKIPDVIYNSKYVRMVLLSEQPKLQAWWELETIRVLKALCDADQLKDMEVCVHSDELIINCGDRDTSSVEELIKSIEANIPNTFRTKSFKLTFIPGFRNNYVCKTSDDGSKRLMNIAPWDYLDLHKRYVLGSEAEEGTIGPDDPEWQERLKIEKAKPFIPADPNATFSDDPDSDTAKRRAFFAQSNVDFPK